MAKLYFYYSTMNAGKSTTLLQCSYNDHERGMKTLILLPEIDTRDQAGKVRSGGNERYVSVCRRHFKDGMCERAANELPLLDSLDGAPAE